MKDRITKLKNMIFDKPPLLSIEVSKIMTWCPIDESQPYVIRCAEKLKNVLENLTVRIMDDELIVGVPGRDMKCAQLFFPESDPRTIEKELPNLATREFDPFIIMDDEIDDLHELIDYWKGNTIPDEINKHIEKESKDLLDSGVFFTQKELGYGHCLGDFKKILDIGFKGVAQEAQHHLDNDLSATQEQRIFWRAVLIVIEGVRVFAGRYADLARKLADNEENEERRKELLEIARICDRVPYEGATSFHEALQSVWFTQMVIALESNGTGVSFGSFDRYMYPYYVNSLNDGMSKDELQELLDCFWIKTNHILKFRSINAAALWVGYIVNQNVTIGGQDKAGNDATNELTYMCLESEGKLHLKEPQFTLRVHEGTPDELLMKATEVVSGGGGKPQFVGDSTVIPALMSAGIPLVEAREYDIIGCVEPAIVGGWGRHKSGHLNLTKVLELALNNGYDPIKYMTISKQTGDVREAKDFDEFMEIFADQLEYVVGKMVHVQRDITHSHLRKYLPHVYLSSLYPCSIERGKSFVDGGAKYDWSSFTATGLANLIDSLYTIKKMVYEDKSITMDELLDALRNNYEGKNVLLAHIKKLPKYGNDNNDVDMLGSRVSQLLYDIGAKFEGDNHSKVFFGFVTVTKSVAYGKFIGATPDGRKAGQPLADGVSPSHGYDQLGPTAIFKSVDKVDLVRATEGAILNQKFIPEALEKIEQRERFVNLLKTYMLDLRGLHVQFNIVSAKTLRDAQAHPEQYRDLLVRVSGFSAYFVELSRDVQEDVIGRTEHRSV